MRHKGDVRGAIPGVASTALAQLTRLSQIASNPALVFRKYMALRESLKRWTESSPTFSRPLAQSDVWSNYVKSIEAILERLRGTVQ